MDEIKKLSDSKLRKKLAEFGFTAGPITDTTRSVHESKLLEYLRPHLTKALQCTSSQSVSPNDCTAMQVDIVRVTDKLDDRIMMKRQVRVLPDFELRRCLVKEGLACGPITDSSRSVYRNLLLEKMKGTGPGVISIPDPSLEELRFLHSSTSSKLTSRAVEEIQVDLSKVDLRDFSNKTMDHVRTALALYNGSCLQRPNPTKVSHPAVKGVGILFNHRIEELYELRVNDLRQKGVSVKEIVAYHATCPNNVQSILHSNLNPSLPPVHGRRFGPGCYFSEFPEFSQRYGKECMFIFQLILVEGLYLTHARTKEGFCQQIVIEDVSLFKPRFALYF